MKLSRAALALPLVAAFTPQRHITTRSVSHLVNGNKNALQKYSTTTAIPMIFERLFGGGGGAFETKIDYTGLQFPGNELGELATQGKVVVNSQKYPNLQAATLAGGCFWGIELLLQRIEGVEYTCVGYTQGPESNPTYNNVCAGATGHTEAVLVYYDPTRVSFEKILDVFFSHINPTTKNGQGRDFGPQYRTGVYTHTDEQLEAAKNVFAKLPYKKIATELKPATPFWPAEKYHQQYLEKGGRFGTPQDASKGSTETIRCYG